MKSNATGGAGAAGDKEKARNLESALGQIDKEFGKGSVMRLGDQGAIIEGS